MGMDVHGTAPTSGAGAYFRNNIWWWHPLADICCSLAPDVCAACEHWHSNDGDGLDADGAAALAAVLEARIADGTVARLIDERDRYLAALPDEPCRLCGGKGVRSDEFAVASGWDKQPCNACDGKGLVRPTETNYPADVENVAEFAAFLKASGGFAIW